MNLSIAAFIYQIPAIIIAMTIHEFVKAQASAKLGDQMPGEKGRLTLNPLKHIEPIGFICMLFLGYGWSNPTETNAMYYKDRKKGTLIVYVLPILVNIIVGILFSFGLKFFNSYANKLLYTASDNLQYLKILKGVGSFLFYIAHYNIALGVFNILPVYPLNGAKILGVYLSPNNRVKLSNYEKIFQIILILLLFTGIMGMILDPVCGILMGLRR